MTRNNVLENPLGTQFKEDRKLQEKTKKNEAN